MPSDLTGSHLAGQNPSLPPLAGFALGCCCRSLHSSQTCPGTPSQSSGVESSSCVPWERAPLSAWHYLLSGKKTKEGVTGRYRVREGPSADRRV